MFRLAVVLIGILWASLLLISWSGPADGQHLTETPRQLVQDRR